ncbi:hypothetical protein [Paenibacillus sp. P36]|uniref:hypothetical protein n=1 Tax=Paenibacillus sp. P36 TaxID=3342538 RepID=UPI0038B328EC
MATCHEHYLGIVERCKDIVNMSFVEGRSEIHAQNHNFLNDLHEWLEVLKDRPEFELYNMAFKEYSQGLINISQGSYRQAYNSLRFFIEHSLAAVYFSFRELDLRLWMCGQQDIYWSTITDENNGIFSKSYFTAFSPPLIEESPLFLQLAKKLYRECSEYTHGNYVTAKILPPTLAFSDSSFRDWHEKAETASMLVVFSLCSRYFSFFGPDAKVRLETSIMEHIGHISFIRDSFQTPQEVF